MNLIYCRKEVSKVIFVSIRYFGFGDWSYYSLSCSSDHMEIGDVVLGESFVTE